MCFGLPEVMHERYVGCVIIWKEKEKKNSFVYKTIYKKENGKNDQINREKGKLYKVLIHKLGVYKILQKTNNVQLIGQGFRWFDIQNKDINFKITSSFCPFVIVVFLNRQPSTKNQTTVLEKPANLLVNWGRAWVCFSTSIDDVHIPTSFSESEIVLTAYHL